jgi:hypothetical protein
MLLCSLLHYHKLVQQPHNHFQALPGLCKRENTTEYHPKHKTKQGKKCIFSSILMAGFPFMLKFNKKSLTNEGLAQSLEQHPIILEENKGLKPIPIMDFAQL